MFLKKAGIFLLIMLFVAACSDSKEEISNPTPTSNERKVANATEEPAEIKSLDVGSLQFVEYHWIEGGLTFEYPSGWEMTRNADPYQMVLFAPSDVEIFIGFQHGSLSPTDTLESVVNQFAARSETTPQEIKLGEVDAYRLNIPQQNNVSLVIIAYMPNDHEIALVNFQARNLENEDFTALVERVLSSAEATTVDLDETALNVAFKTSLDAGQTMTIGDANAPVTMVEVLDFSCPHCVDYHASIARVIQDYVQTGKVKLQFVYVTFIGGDASVTATTATLCAADQNRGWDMHSLLMEGFLSNSGRGFYTADNIITSVEEKELGLDVEQFRACMEEKPYSEFIEQQGKLAEELGIDSTPSVLFATGDEIPQFIMDSSGQKFSGGVPLTRLYAHLDSLLD